MEQIDIDRAKELMDKNEINIIDIRDQNSFEEAHIQNAVHVHDGNLEDFINTADKNKPLMCYCYHGFSSQNAAAFFKERGFKTVYSMEGGFEAWRSQYPIANES